MTMLFERKLVVKICALGTLLLFVHPLLAQETSIAPEFSEAVISPSFGITYTDIYMSGDANSTVETTPQVGFSVGISVYVPSSSPYVDYQTGLYYAQSRTNFRIQEDNLGNITVSDYDLTLQRLSVPIIAKVYPFEKSVGLYFNGGVVGNYLLSGKISGSDSTNGVITQSYNRSLDDTDGYNSFVLDGLLGVGYAQSFGGVFGFGIEFNYRYGLTKLVDSNDARADTFYVSFGIGF